MFIEFKEAMKQNFEMTYLSLMSYFLVLKYTKIKKAYLCHNKKQKYATDILKITKIDTSSPIRTQVEKG